jgi:mono/diheme cytochrome c family protein
MRTTKILMCGVAAGMLGLGSAPALVAQEAGHFTAEQAARGAERYAAQCATCHGANLEGNVAPALIGTDTMQTWGTAAGLFEYIHVAMPPNAPGTLPEQDYLDILAHILSKNGFAPGETELANDTSVLAAISLLGATAPTDTAAAEPASLDAPSAVPQAFTFGKTLPSVEPPAAAADTATAPAATPSVPQAFTFGKTLPAVETPAAQ